MNRIDVIKGIRDKLNSGGYSIGSWMQIPNSSIAEIMGCSGYDWVAVDMEHGAISVYQLPDLFRALELGGTLPLVRLAEGGTGECKQALDAGAGGVIVPMVESDSQLQQTRNYCCWPPSGTRGVAFSRANMFGGSFENYVEEAQAPLLIAMIESARGLENIDQILSVKGLDAILVGPYDLSASLGVTGQFECKKFIDALAVISNAAKVKEIPLGIHVVQPSRDELRSRINQGYRFIAYSIDAVMLRSQANYKNS